MEKIDARKLSREALEHIRRQAFLLRQQGCLWVHIAEAVGVHVGTALKWAHRAGTIGVDSVFRVGSGGRRHGSGRKLTLVQEEQLRLNIMSPNPAQRQFEFAVWNRRAVILAVEELFGIDVPIRTVGEYLPRWSFAPQCSVKRALEQSPDLFKAWYLKTHPMIAARAKSEGAEIYWGDETAIRHDSHWVRGYSMAGVTLELRLPAGRDGSTLIISAITNQGLVRFSFFEGVIDADRFVLFLKGLAQDAQCKVFLVVDNLRVHRAKRVIEREAESAEKIELFYLPPYAPELNPGGYPNRDLKATIRTGPIAKTATALLEKARTYMGHIAAMPDQSGRISSMSMCGMRRNLSI